MTQPHIVDSDEVAWINGADVFETMEPAFRDNLGHDQDEVRDLLSRYWLKQLWIDDKSRRIDHVRTDPGYVDLCEAYHDSVEESFFLAGTCNLTAEGTFVAGDYFWRPPGWVHMARAPEGFEAILMMEGQDETEGSDRVSRVVRPDSDAGRNPRPGQDQGLGPRGYVRRAESRFMVWREHDDDVTELGEPAGVTSKVLSLNRDTGSRTALIALPDGWSSSVASVQRERFLVPVNGTLAVDGRQLSPCSLVRLGPGETATLSAHGPVEVLMKVGAPR